MKRSPLQRKTPMSRGTSTLKRSPPKPANDNVPKLARSAIAKKAPKKRPGHNKSMREACRGQPCYLEIPGVCRGEIDRETVVPCHANWSAYGKGAGLKAADTYTVPGCWRCHSWLDQGPAPKETKREAWEAAYARWSAYRDVA